MEVNGNPNKIKVLEEKVEKLKLKNKILKKRIRKISKWINGTKKTITRFESFIREYHNNDEESSLETLESSSSLSN